MACPPRPPGSTKTEREIGIEDGSAALHGDGDSFAGGKCVLACEGHGERAQSVIGRAEHPRVVTATSHLEKAGDRPVEGVGVGDI